MITNAPLIFARFTDLLTHPENPLRCIRLCRFVIGDMDLLTEVGPSALRHYKHGPPDGGLPPQRRVTINMDLLTEVGSLNAA